MCVRYERLWQVSRGWRGRSTLQLHSVFRLWLTQSENFGRTWMYWWGWNRQLPDIPTVLRVVLPFLPSDLPPRHHNAEICRPRDNYSDSAPYYSLCWAVRRRFATLSTRKDFRGGACLSIDSSNGCARKNCHTHWWTSNALLRLLISCEGFGRRYPTVTTAVKKIFMRLLIVWNLWGHWGRERDLLHQTLSVVFVHARSTVMYWCLSADLFSNFPLLRWSLQ